MHVAQTVSYKAKESFNCIILTKMSMTTRISTVLLAVVVGGAVASAFVLEPRGFASPSSSRGGLLTRKLAESNLNTAAATTGSRMPQQAGQAFAVQVAHQGKSLLTSLSEGYSRLTSEHYLAMAFLQAGFLASSADMITQTMESAPFGIDFAHVAAMATVASTFSGAMNAIWLRQLEQAFPGTATSAVATKTLIHAVILASIINSAYLVGVPLFTEHLFAMPNADGIFHLASKLSADPSSLWAGWTLDEFTILTKLEIFMFIPYNAVAFRIIPPNIRPLTHAAVSATFNVAVSAVTLGYFDAWCERATSTFQHALF